MGWVTARAHWVATVRAATRHTKAPPAVGRAAARVVTAPRNGWRRARGTQDEPQREPFQPTLIGPRPAQNTVTHYGEPERDWLERRAPWLCVLHYGRVSSGA
jgi:hypothetical protein